MKSKLLLLLSSLKNKWKNMKNYLLFFLYNKQKKLNNFKHKLLYNFKTKFSVMKFKLSSLSIKLYGIKYKLLLFIRENIITEFSSMYNDFIHKIKIRDYQGIMNYLYLPMIIIYLVFFIKYGYIYDA